MTTELIAPNNPFSPGYFAPPALITAAGERATKTYIEFFTANIRNPNTRNAYLIAINRFLYWCDDYHIELNRIEPVAIASYIELLQQTHSVPSVKQHLAAIKVFFDALVLSQVCSRNSAHSVRGPKHIVRRGKTPVLTSEQARQLLGSIETTTLIGLRDRALIGVMVYSFARVSAVVSMNVQDYYQNGKRCWLRLKEKGGKHHEVPAHHIAEQYLDEYLKATGITNQPQFPLFRSIPARTGKVSDSRIHRRDVLSMIKRRSQDLNLPNSICCHTFRATGITTYLQNGGTLENAQNIAAHNSPRTTMLYDRRSDEITLDEIERILI